jgi:hypothetical protein
MGKWCKNKHGASKIIDTFETYHSALAGAIDCSVQRAQHGRPNADKVKMSLFSCFFELDAYREGL